MDIDGYIKLEEAFNFIGFSFDPFAPFSDPKVPVEVINDFYSRCPLQLAYKGWVKLYHYDSLELQTAYLDGMFEILELDETNGWYVLHSSGCFTTATHESIAIDDMNISIEVDSTEPLDFYIDHKDLKGFCKLKGITEPVKAHYSKVVTAEKSTNQNKAVDFLHENTSPDFITMIEANDKFWKNYDPKDSTTAPNKQQVVDWLTNDGINKTIAEKMDTILRDGRSNNSGRPTKENP